MAPSDPGPLSDAELLQALRERDPEAFGALYRRHQGAIYRFALHVTGLRSAADEVTQEVFLALMRGLDSIDAGRGTVGMWLYGVARHQARRWLSRERKHASLPLDEPDALSQVTDADPFTDLAREERIDAVRDALSRLPVAHREVIVLCDLQELSYVEAAGVLDCAVGTVRSRLHRARSLLARILGAPGRETQAGRKEPKCLT
jgi:RNA polymerase sigma-70 factor (ECF subfamily)